MYRKQCPNCSGYNIVEVTEGNLAIYFCYDCQKKSGFAKQFDGKIVMKSGKNGIKHVTVGALIERDGKYLLAKRRTYPYRFSFPAGHLEYGETPLRAVKREIFEEIGMKLEKAQLIFHDDIVGNKCRAGANTHEWFFYKAECNGLPIVNSELEYANWYSIEEIEKLDLGFATRILLENIGLLKKVEK